MSLFSYCIFFISSLVISILWFFSFWTYHLHIKGKIVHIVRILWNIKSASLKGVQYISCNLSTIPIVPCCESIFLPIKIEFVWKVWQIKIFGAGIIFYLNLLSACVVLPAVFISNCPVIRSGWIMSVFRSFLKFWGCIDNSYAPCLNILRKEIHVQYLQIKPLYTGVACSRSECDNASTAGKHSLA